MLHKTTKIVQKFMGGKFFITGLLLTFLSTTQADVVTSIRPLGFIAAAITNGVTGVQILLPDGASPHNYALKPFDLEKMKTADLFVWVGSNLETFLEKPLAQLPIEKRTTLSEDPDIKARLLKSNEDIIVINNKNSYSNNYDHHLHGVYNMHIWLSPDIVRIAANIIYHRLVALYPKYQKQLDINLRKFDEKLTQTDQNLAKILKSVGNKQYFIFHNAYSYFEKQYHLTSSGYFTNNPIIQPGAQKLYQIRTILAQKKVVCVFAEPQFRAAMIKAVIKDNDVYIGTLDPLGIGIRLSKDSYVEFLTTLSNQFKSCLDKR